MKIYLAAILIFVFTVGAFAQSDKKNSGDAARPDFSGTWTIDRTKTKKLDFDLKLIVVQKEPEMKVTKIYNFKGAKKIDEQTYYTDGRRTPDETTDTNIVSIDAAWSGNAYIRKRQISRVQGKAIVLTTTEKWELSKDGKTLTLTLTETVPATNPNEGGSVQTQGILSSADYTKVIKFQRAEETVQ